MGHQTKVRELLEKEGKMTFQDAKEKLKEKEEKMNETMNFTEAFEALVTGKKVRRLDWEDQNIYVKMVNEQVMIYTPSDKMMHPLVVSLGDIEGIDWVVVGGKVKN